MQRRDSPLTDLALWLAPVAVLLGLYWYGLRVWYQMDDFAWLNLHTLIHDVPSFFSALFQPLAQGTVRPWSERLYFLLGWGIGGLESSWLLRGIAILTQIGNVLLVMSVTRRLTGGSLVAASAAALLWISNSNNYAPMGWSASYNQILCGFFLLLAFRFWIRYTDTGDQRWYWLQFCVFLLGFGALELNVVYPGLALLFALCFDRRKFAMRTVPMFCVSAVYTVMHRLTAAGTPGSRSDTYRLYFDFGVFHTLWTYLRLEFGAERYARLRFWPDAPFQAAEVVAGVAVFAFAAWMIARRQWFALFGIGWFGIVLAPVLPLKNHVTDYYLFLPTIGLAMVAGWGVSLAIRRGWVVRLSAAVAVLAYMLPSAAMARGMTIQYFPESRRTRTLVRSVAFAHKLHPKQTIVIRHVDDAMFWNAWWDHSFQLFGREKIYVAGEDEPRIGRIREEATLPRFFLSEREQLAGLRAGTVVVYEMLPTGHLRNVSELRREVLARDASLGSPKYLAIGLPEAAPFLKSGLWQPEGHFRWSARRAEFVLRGPSTQNGELVITGMCPEQHMKDGPLHLTVYVDGERLDSYAITRDNLQFELRQKLPASLAGRPSVVIGLEVERVLQMPRDLRELGVAVGTAEVVH